METLSYLCFIEFIPLSGGSSQYLGTLTMRLKESSVVKAPFIPVMV